MNRTLKLTQDGRIDVAALDEWLLDDLREWLLARLSSADPLWPVDQANFETPDALFVRLWREADSGSRFVERLGRACDGLLHEAWGKAPEPWLRPLLRLVATIRPDACRSFLNGVATHRNFSPEMREQDLDEAWLDTLAAYDRQSPDLVKVWRELLRDPRYADIAYRALSHDLTQAVWFLPEYYQVLAPTERSVLLPEAVRGMLRWDTGTVLATLARYRTKLTETPGLCGAIVAALKEMAYPPAFASASAPAAGPTPAQRPESACLKPGGANMADEAPSAQEASFARSNGASVLVNITNERAPTKAAA